MTRTSNVIPDLRLACFRCAKCGHEHLVNNEGGKVEEPQVVDGERGVDEEPQMK